MPRTKPSENGSPVPSIARHASSCRICKHPDREEIERDFIAWESPEDIAAQYKIPNRASVYRHAHAFGLFAKRGRNLVASLDRVIEKVGRVEITAGAVVQAIALRARMNGRGELVQPTENLSLHDVFALMSRDEFDSYAKSGVLPPRFSQFLGATGKRDTEGPNHA